MDFQKSFYSSRFKYCHRLARGEGAQNRTRKFVPLTRCWPEITRWNNISMAKHSRCFNKTVYTWRRLRRHCPPHNRSVCVTNCRIATVDQWNLSANLRKKCSPRLPAIERKIILKKCNSSYALLMKRVILNYTTSRIYSNGNSSISINWIHI